MNIRKPVDYSAMYEELDALVAADLPQMKLYCGIGQLVNSRPEKGAAVAAAEYLQNKYPDLSGFSPRNLRRMRKFYRTYENTPRALAQAMNIGWTQNVVILEAELTAQERIWYIHAVQQFNWSKLELQRQINAGAHKKNALDINSDTCYTEENHFGLERNNHDESAFCSLWKYMPQPNGRILNEELGEKIGLSEPIPHRVCRHQHRGDWQSGLSPGPP